MRGNLFKWICTLLYLVLTNEAPAYDLHNIGRLYGMPVRKVTSLCNDAHGFVYGVSPMGVIRISASECRTYTLPSSSGFLSAHISAIRNDIYVCTRDGQMFTYDSKTDAFVHLLDLNTAQQQAKHRK